MGRRFAILAALALYGSATGVRAAEATGQDIVVTGQAPAAKRKAAEDFVRATGIAAQANPVARWVDRICPKVYGIPDTAVRARIEQRVRVIAETVGAPLAPARCVSNFAIVFTSDGPGFARSIYRRDFRRMSRMTPVRRAQILEGQDPVRWWYGSDLRGKDGRRAAAVAPPWTSGNAEGGGSVIPLGPETDVIDQRSPTLIGTQAIRTLTGATVVVDVTRADGAPLDAVTDYAAFVGLAEVAPPGKPPADSVLGLFGTEPRPRELTGQDIAFLRAVYRLALDRTASQQRVSLVGAIVEGQR